MTVLYVLNPLCFNSVWGGGWGMGEGGGGGGGGGGQGADVPKTEL